MIRILIADDHSLIRSGLTCYLNRLPSMQVVAVAENGNQVLEHLRGTQVDLLLLDLNMPGMNGEGLIIRICALYPRIPVLVLTAHEETAVAQRAMRAGASGFISKGLELANLLVAIHRVAAGGRYIEPAIARRIAQEHAVVKPTALEERLTGREFQVMRLLAEGISVKDIAAKLMISSKTVSTHKAKVMSKMGFLCAVDIVRYAQALRTP